MNIQTDGNQPIGYLTGYKSYIALLSQSDTEDPTVIVMNNNDSNYLGDIVWTRDSTGSYRGTLTGIFTNNKTYLLISDNLSTSAGKAIIYQNDEDSIGIDTRQYDNTYVDGVMFNTAIEVRVYP